MMITRCYKLQRQMLRCIGEASEAAPRYSIVNWTRRVRNPHVSSIQPNPTFPSGNLRGG